MKSLGERLNRLQAQLDAAHQDADEFRARVMASRIGALAVGLRRPVPASDLTDDLPTIMQASQ